MNLLNNILNYIDFLLSEGITTLYYLQHLDITANRTKHYLITFADENWLTYQTYLITCFSCTMIVLHLYIIADDRHHTITYDIMGLVIIVLKVQIHILYWDKFVLMYIK